MLDTCNIQIIFEYKKGRWVVKGLIFDIPCSEIALYQYVVFKRGVVVSLGVWGASTSAGDGEGG